MIEPEMARRFIEQVTQYTEYNINIMDERGVIIASRDPARVGTYHEVADRIIRGGEDVLVIRDDKMFPGVLPGINMAVMLDGRREGVVGVTGDPDRIRDVAMITRMAMEAMLKYEKQQEEIRLRRNRKEHFLGLLTQVEFASPSEIRGIARQLDLKESLARVPVLCRLKTGTGGKDGSSLAGEALEALRRGRGHWVQDFSYVMDESHLLVFKTVRTDKRRSFMEYREEIRDYLEYIQSWTEQNGIGAVFYVGTLQDSFSQYYYAYRHCRWLESHVDRPEKIVFFRDHIREYFRILVPRHELQRIFHIYEDMLSGSDIMQFKEIAGALEDTNYNLTEASARLFVHKNTLVYRYNRMKDILGIDPMTSPEDRKFVELLRNYLIRQEQ